MKGQTMKLLVFGDLHLTDKKPKNRKDSDYFSSVLQKFLSGLDKGKNNGCEYCIFPGDVFDSFKASHHVVQQVIRCLRMFPTMQYLAVPGQHDECYHSTDLANTPIKTLFDAGLISLLNKEAKDASYIDFYGAGYGEEIPEIKNSKAFNILVTHRMIIDEKLWNDQEEYERANGLLLKHKYDLVCSGDNHQCFTATVGNRHLINLGSLMRTNISQHSHKPSVAIFDTTTRKFEIIPLDVEPFDEIMDTTIAEKEKVKNEELDSFITSLKSTEVTSLDFMSALNDYIKDNEVDESISNIIKGALT
jgi:DNA repair exonuclease SbcCD nuclease subunit